MDESQFWKSNKFRLFEKLVQTKSTSCLYVDRQDPQAEKEYVYNGSKVFHTVYVKLTLVAGRST